MLSLEYEIYALENLMSHSKEVPEGKPHIEYLETYLEPIKKYRFILRKIYGLLPDYEDKLIKYLKKFEKELTVNDVIEIEDITFYPSFYKGQYTFYSPIE